MKRITLKIDSNFHGPTILELEPVLNEIVGPIEVNWTNSKAEIQCLRRFPGRQFILITLNISIMERTASQLGLPFNFDMELLNAVKQALVNRKNLNWRPMAEGMGLSTTRSLLTKVSAEALRNGKRPRATTSVTNDCIFSNLNPVDAEVLVRLRRMRR